MTKSRRRTKAAQRPPKSCASRTLAPRVRTLLADTETPLSVWLKLTALQGPDYSYLFESAQGGERWGRYSIIGLPAARHLQVRGHSISLHNRGGETLQQWHSDDPLDFIEQWRRAVRAAPAPGLPRAAGGLVGYFAYDIARYSEPRLAASAPPDDLGLAEILLMETTEVAVFDNLMGTLSLVVWSAEGADASPRLDELEQLLQSPMPPLPPLPLDADCPLPDFDTSIARQDYCAMVERIRGHIAAGELMQAVPSQRLSLGWDGDAVALYRALRHTNPSPYMYLMHLGSRQLVGSSPEILARLESTTITARPIAGTRPRGADAAEDARLAEELLADPKERAEHLMLIDLGRNDIGRVAATGTVRVTETMAVERFSHVMHICSQVQGRLRQGLGPMDVLRALHPAGTLSGAPKVRAMQLIDELEPVRRGIYGGALGWVSWHGDMDMAIAIRTALIQDGRLHIQAGGGVVADSDPASEWQESINKAGALLRAAALSGGCR